MKAKNSFPTEYFDLFCALYLYGTFLKDYIYSCYEKWIVSPPSYVA